VFGELEAKSWRTDDGGLHDNEAVQERGTFGMEGFRRTLAGVRGADN
jgi:hypothetical protein